MSLDPQPEFLQAASLPMLNRLAEEAAPTGNPRTKATRTSKEAGTAVNEPAGTAVNEPARTVLGAAVRPGTGR